MKKKLSIIFSLILGLVIIFYLYFRIGFEKIFSELLYLKPWQIFVIFFISWFAFILTVLRSRFVLQDFSGEKISLRLMTKARLAESALSYFTPIVYTGGEILRLIILKRDRNIFFSDNISAIWIERLSELIGLIIFLFFGGVFLFFIKESGLGLIFFGLAVIILILIILALKILGLTMVLSFCIRFFGLSKIKYVSEKAGETSIGERLQSSLNSGLLYLRNKTKNFILTVFIYFIVLLLWALQIKLLVGFMGQDISLFKVYLVKILILVSGFAPVVARIGTFEAAYLAGFAIFGLSAQTAIACALMIRVVELTIVGAGVIIGLHYLGDLFWNINKVFKKNNYNNNLNHGR